MIDDVARGMAARHMLDAAAKLSIDSKGTRERFMELAGARFDAVKDSGSRRTGADVFTKLKLLLNDREDREGSS